MDPEVAGFVQCLIAEGHLDEQFQQLLMLQDEADPHFVRGVIEMYFEDSASALQNISKLLEQPTVDFGAIDQTVHQLKGSSASLGAAMVTQLAVQLRAAVQQQRKDEAVAFLRSITEARNVLQERLNTFVQLEDRAKSG